MRTFETLLAAIVVASLALLADAQPGKESVPNGPVRRVEKTGHISNYDEAKVKPYALPDPLKFADGQPVNDARTWLTKRRPEILKLFQTEIFGRVPESAPKVTWEVVSTAPNPSIPNVTVKKVVGHMGDKANGPAINLLLYEPANSNGLMPVILTISFGPSLKGPADKKGGKPTVDPAMERVLAKGWAYATINYGDIQPDRDKAFDQGVIGLSLRPGQKEPAADEWGGVSAWAWGISRVIDYLETDKSIDAHRIGVQGHSRLGRTALWAAAQDERIAVAFASCSGEAGAALARRDWGETVDDMAQNFPWQLAGNYQKWVGHWDDMPVDSHMLIALVAPRALFCNGGLADQWADPKGEFLGMVAAGPVYRLLGKNDLGAATLPPLDTPLIAGDLGWNYHSEGHLATPADWSAFLDFAARHFE